MIRVRHYTRKSSKDKIIEEETLRAKDQSKVFVEHANGDPYSPRDAEARYLLKRGRGNAYVEFYAEEDEVEEQINPLTGRKEFFLRGDVDLTDRDADWVDNV